MGTTIFWVCALALFPPGALIFGPLQFVLGIIAQLGGLVVLFTDSVIPNQYVWGAISIFLIQCFPPIRALGGIAAAVIAGPDPQGRDINLGDSIVGSVAGLIYNFGGLSHSSVSLLDAVSMMKGIPKIEVHLSHLIKRETYRQKLITAEASDAFISGLGYYGYLLAAESIVYYQTEKGSAQCMIPTSFAKD